MPEEGIQRLRSTRAFRPVLPLKHLLIVSLLHLTCAPAPDISKIRWWLRFREWTRSGSALRCQSIAYLLKDTSRLKFRYRLIRIKFHVEKWNILPSVDQPRFRSVSRFLIRMSFKPGMNAYLKLNTEAGDAADTKRAVIDTGKNLARDYCLILKASLCRNRSTFCMSHSSPASAPA